MKYFIGTLALLMTFSGAIFAGNENGLEDRVTALESKVSTLQTETEDADTGLGSRVTKLEGIQDEMENWSVYARKHHGIYNSSGVFVGQILTDYPDSVYNFLQYSLNGEVGYIHMVPYGASFLPDAQERAYSDESCTEVVILKNTYYEPNSSSHSDEWINFVASYEYKHGYINDYYIHKVDLSTSYTTTVYTNYSSVCNEWTQAGTPSVYSITDSEYLGTDNSYSDSDNLFTSVYIDELP